MNRASCTICSDLLTAENCSACPCGHTYHYACILNWGNQSRTCPQCRAKFKEPLRLFFEQSCEANTVDDPSVLQNAIGDLKIKVKTAESIIEDLRSQLLSIKAERVADQDEIFKLSQLLNTSRSTNDALKKQLSMFERYQMDLHQAKSEVGRLEKKIDGMKNIQAMIDGERHSVEAILKSFPDSADSLQQITTSFVIMKKEFQKLKEGKHKLESERKIMKRKVEEANQRLFECQEQLKLAEADLVHVSEQKKNLEAKVQKLELAFSSPSPRSSAIKRLLKESPAPLDFKRPRLKADIDKEASINDPNDSSIVLFDGDDEVESQNAPNDSALCETHDNAVEIEEIDTVGSEFGLRIVETTSVTALSKTLPLRDCSNRLLGKSSLPFKSRPASVRDASRLAHTRVGYNGLGGKSKVLVPAQSVPLLAKPVSKNVSRKVKIPKSVIANGGISKFLSGPKLSHVS